MMKITRESEIMGKNKLYIGIFVSVLFAGLLVGGFFIERTKRCQEDHYAHHMQYAKQQMREIDIKISLEEKQLCQYDCFR